MGLVDLECKPALFQVKGKDAQNVKTKFKQTSYKFLKLIMIMFV